jgi:hypothetical protein
MKVKLIEEERTELERCDKSACWGEEKVTGANGADDCAGYQPKPSWRH